MILSGFRIFIENTVMQTLRIYQKTQPKLKELDLLLAYTKEQISINLIAQHDKDISRFANWILYWSWQDFQSSDIKELEMMFNDYIRSTILQFQSTADYIVSKWDQLQSKFNNPKYTPELLKTENNQWHKELTEKKRTSAATDGQVILNFEDGFKWVILPRGYCEKEGKAMGHCGNINASPGDNIFSLRNKSNQAFLTFVVNNGFLGESKGFGNEKPNNKYHKYIVELLKAKDQNGSNYIGCIEGGGYKPQNNFYFTDLTKEQQDNVTSTNPYITQPIKFILDNYNKDSVEKMNKIINSKAITFTETWLNDEFMLNVQLDSDTLFKNYIDPQSIAKCWASYKKNSLNTDYDHDQLVLKRNNCINNSLIIDEKISTAIEKRIDAYLNASTGWHDQNSKEIDDFINGYNWDKLEKFVFNLIDDCFYTIVYEKKNDIYKKLSDYLKNNKNKCKFVYDKINNSSYMFAINARISKDNLKNLQPFEIKDCLLTPIFYYLNNILPDIIKNDFAKIIHYKK